MAPRARRVLPSKAMAGHTSVGGENDNPAAATNGHQTRRKRTLSSAQPSASGTSSMPATNVPPPSKRLRKDGPARARPMQLNLTSSDEPDQQGLTAIDNGKGKDKESNPPPLKRTTSFYPGRDGPAATSRSHIRMDVARENDPFVDLYGNDSDVETEAEWFESHIEDAAPKNVSKVSEAMAAERPTWDSSVNASGSGASLPQGSDDTTLHGSSTSGGDDVSMPTYTPTPTNTPTPNPVWPSDTELALFPGTNKILLTLQSVLMREIFQDSFENLRVSLLFVHAFPDPSLTRSMTSEALAAATQSRMPRSSNIQTRLQLDEEYMSKMCRLPRARIPIFRGEVKERCAGLIFLSFYSVGSAPATAKLVEKELSNYFYTFPTTQIRGDALNLLPLRTRPYRNARIVSVIRELYFSGGTTSYAYRFDDRFPTSLGEDGVIRHEVPIPMVALVATALYAAIHEWRSGKHHPTEFSANAYLDVYQGHIDTFHHIQEHRPRAFHTMMSDIYSQASEMDSAGAVPIADLDINQLEG